MCSLIKCVANYSKTLNNIVVLLKYSLFFLQGPSINRVALTIQGVGVSPTNACPQARPKDLEAVSAI